MVKRSDDARFRNLLNKSEPTYVKWVLKVLMMSNDHVSSSRTSRESLFEDAGISYN